MKDKERAVSLKKFYLDHLPGTAAKAESPDGTILFYVVEKGTLRDNLNKASGDEDKDFVLICYIANGDLYPMRKDSFGLWRYAELTDVEMITRDQFLAMVELCQPASNKVSITE